MLFDQAGQISGGVIEMACGGFQRDAGIMMPHVQKNTGNFTVIQQPLKILGVFLLLDTGQLCKKGDQSGVDHLIIIAVMFCDFGKQV